MGQFCYLQWRILILLSTARCQHILKQWRKHKRVIIQITSYIVAHDIDIRYMAFMYNYNTMVHTAQQLHWKNFCHICTHERTPYLVLTDELWDVFRK